MSQLLYYLDLYSDETIAADAPTLDAWTAWLAKPFDEDAQNWARAKQVPDGAEFNTSVLERLEALEVTRTAWGWTHSRQVEADANFFAETFGGGWDAENQHDELDGFLECQIDNGTLDIGESMTIAVCRDAPPVRVRFTREPAPALTIIGSVQ